MSQVYDSINVFDTKCSRGHFVEIALDRHLESVPYEDLATFVLRVTLNLDGSVTLLQKSSTVEGLLLTVFGDSELEDSFFTIRSGQELPLAALLNGRYGKIHNQGVPGRCVVLAVASSPERTSLGFDLVGKYVLLREESEHDEVIPPVKDCRRFVAPPVETNECTLDLEHAHAELSSMIIERPRPGSSLDTGVPRRRSDE